MKKIVHVVETKYVFTYLHKRNLVTMYRKAKEKLILGYMGGLDFKERKPRGSNIWAFRINKQFRAIGRFDEQGHFIVSDIDNHQ